jgi:hypothetical protein
MARIRSIKPGFFANEGLSEVSEPAQILAGGLLCYSDDEGYFNAHPGLVKAAVFPLREPSKPIPGLMGELVGIGYVRLGNGSDGKRYGQVVNFKEHQKVSHAIPSKIKGMQIAWEVSRKSPEDSVRTPEVLRPELNRIELNRIEKKKNLKPSAAPSACGSEVSKSLAQTRHSRIQEMIFSAYREQNSVNPPWDGGEGNQLKALLTATPGWHDSQLAQCLANMYASGGFAKGTRPREFLPGLPKYLNGPLNEFNREQSNGSGNSKGDRKAADISKTTREVFGGSGVVHGNDPARLPLKAASAGVGAVAGNSQRLLVSGVKSGDDPPDK